ncbi:hypothetical protein [Croceiramulus getboli]|nr:hypothetical protein P8624_04585 [Flavobacteriaceae bacterium YJPT1-3]
MRTSFDYITQKLDQYIKKYYTNELIKGVILFIALGALYLLIALLIEYLLWLPSTGRALLFWSFVLVELALGIRFIIIPLLRLLKVTKGIDYTTAATHIGAHFPEVEDKLINTLQLVKDAAGDELRMAGVAQKCSVLEPVPFSLAIDFKSNLNYLKYAAIPFAILILGSLVAKEDLWGSSYSRVVNYAGHYAPPAPFEFVIVNQEMTTVSGTNFTLQVKTIGKTLPENVVLMRNGERYLMRRKDAASFEYTFEQPQQDEQFLLVANEVQSQNYELKVIQAPVISQFTMQLKYPKHTNKVSETISNSGNAIIPEGTLVNWTLKARHADAVEMILKDTVFLMEKSDASLRDGESEFKRSERLFQRRAYTVTTSNGQLEQYESLDFNLEVIRDAYPKIELQTAMDPGVEDQQLYNGIVSDDYGVRSVDLIYFEAGKEEEATKVPIANPGSTVHNFTFVFPGTLILEGGKVYQYYFEVKDNDALHGFKTAKSSVFGYRMQTAEEQQQRQLEQQKETLNELDKSLDKWKDQERDLEELSKMQKEKSSLNYNDQKKLEQFLKRQSKQDQLMQEYSEKLKNNLEDFQSEKDDAYKEQLQERLARNEEELSKNEQLLEELEKLRDKISKEELSERLEKLAKQSKNNKTNLEQLLELTKRYYVTQKMEKVASELDKLGKKQEMQADDPKNGPQDQKELNEALEQLEDDLEVIKKANEELKKPMALAETEGALEEIKKEQQEALEELRKPDQQSPSSKARQSQQQAGEKMQQLSQEMKQQMQMMTGESLQEDRDMLRQILDNLVVFSQEEEALMEELRIIDNRNPSFASKLRKQNALRQNFEHVDDSLYALALRQPAINEVITKQLTEIDFNLDKALERLAENQISRGVASQQYVVSGANTLADFLSEVLDNMNRQLSMSGQAQGSGQGMGQGQGDGKQLSDIIKNHGELQKMMEEMLRKSQSDSQGNENGEGEGKNNGENGERGGQENSKGNQEGGDNPNNGAEEGENSEELNALLFEIYKRQQQLRNQLQDEIKRSGIEAESKNLIRQLEQLERNTLNGQLNERSLAQMKILKHRLLEMENAAFKQEQESQRTSITGTQNESGVNYNFQERAKAYFGTTEILNREKLPMREGFKKRVKMYFNQDND